MGFFRSAKSSLLKPFRNLTIQQHILQGFRLGCPIVAAAFVLTYLASMSSTDSCYMATIKSGHLDVAYGLYKSLRTSLSNYSDSDYDGEILPADGELTDSEIQILTSYTETQVADAAQYILMGQTEYCMVYYQTTYKSAHLVAVNVTQTCTTYPNGAIFDYRGLLSEAGLDVILAYAYESSYGSDAAYSLRVMERDKRFRVVKPAMIFEALAQPAICLYGFVLYSNRGEAKDLSNIPSIALHGVAVLSLASGIVMTVAAAFATRELLGTQAEVASGVSSYGVQMELGGTYLSVLWFSFAFAILTMLSWGLPLWCANPPDDGYFSDDEVTYQYHDDPQDKDTFVARPYQVSRQLKKSKVKKTISRLFTDEPLETEIVRSSSTGSDKSKDRSPFASPEDYAMDVFKDGSLQHEMVGSSSQMHSETELRRLGATITRKFSSRRKGARSKRDPNGRREWFPETESTHNLLYGDNLYFNHQYPQTLPGVSEPGSSLTRSSTLNKLSNNKRSRSNTVQSKSAVNALAQSHQDLLKPDMNSELDATMDNVSLLDDREMELLDNNQFVNKIV